MSGQDGDDGYMIISSDTSAETLTNNYYSEDYYQPGDASTIDRSRHVDGHSKIIGISYDGYPITDLMGITQVVLLPERFHHSVLKLLQNFLVQDLK